MDEDTLLWENRPLEHWIETRRHQDGHKRWEAVDAIRHIAAPEISVPYMIDTLRNDSYWRARALAAHAVFDLVAGMNWDDPPQPDQNERDDATLEHRIFLQTVFALAPTIVIALAEALRDEDHHVRMNAVFALREMGRIATPAIPSLKEALDHQDVELREAAQTALDCIERA